MLLKAVSLYTTQVVIIVVMTAFISLRLFKSQPIAKGTSSFISFFNKFHIV